MLKGKMFSTGIILLLTITISSAAQIEGLWQVNRSNDLVEIRSRNNGIMAKFVDSRDWDYYDHLRNNIYEDRKGNRYYFKSNNRLTWESRDGRRVINLERSRDDYRRNGRSDGYDYSNSRNDRSAPTRFYDDGLSGTWTNRWRNTVAYVKYDGYNLRMKTNRGRKWITYRRTNNRRMIFKDQWGNRLKLKNNGRLEWRRADGRRDINFIRN